MRAYVLADLGRPGSDAGGNASITLDDARYLIAVEHGFESWAQLREAVQSWPATAVMTAAPMHVLVAGDADDRPSDDAHGITASRDWHAVLRALSSRPNVILDAHGQMTDGMLDDVSRLPQVIGLQLANSQALTDDGLRVLERLPNLRHLDLGQTQVTDRGVAWVARIPTLVSLSLTMTRVTDAGVARLAACRHLQRLQLMWTGTGDGVIAAFAGHPALAHFWSGSGVTDAGLALLSALPRFMAVPPSDADMGLLRGDTSPNQLNLRGSFTNAGMRSIAALRGLHSLSLDDASDVTARGMLSLVALPRLERLSVNATDEWMPYLAALPALRFLGIQDTPAGDDGFAALSRSPSLEYIWGRRCHNLRTRGFRALSRMPRLRGLSVSCLNVEDSGIATLPEFPALRELMPMDVPDAGYRHIGRCTALERLLLMYCRDTTDAATEHLGGLGRLVEYFNSYTAITDRTPEVLSGLTSLERVTFDSCPQLTNAGVARLTRLPKLQVLRVSGRGLTRDVVSAFPETVTVHYST